MPQLSYEEFIKQSGSDPNAIHPLANKAYSKAYREYLDQYKQEDLQNKVDSRYKDITDFNSDYYKQYGSLLQRLTPQIGVNTLMSPLRAGGFNPTSAKNLATNRARTLSSDRDEAISTATLQFAIGSQNQGNSLLGLYSQNQQFNQELAEKKRQFNESQPTFGDSLLNVGTTILGFGLGKFLSPGSSGGGASQAKARYGY